VKKQRKEKKTKVKRSFKKQVQTFAVDQFFYLVGCVSFAISMNVFALPNKIAQSGFSGIAAILHTVTGWLPVGLSNFALNIPLLIAALVLLGWKFVSKTLWITVELSLVIDLMARFVPWVYTEDRLLAALFCGALRGFGMALIFMRGATSGGTDIIGWLVRKRWPHISLGRVIMFADAAVVAAAAYIYRDINAALYAGIMIFVFTRIIDTMLYGMNNGRLFYIFTTRAQELAAAVISEIGRGATILEATGGFTGNRQDVLLCVIRRGQVSAMRRLIKKHDPNSFLIIAEAREIYGFGWKSE
jgi:uncharacterized membrane-anchored protein YitT (DUF2179 family)